MISKKNLLNYNLMDPPKLDQFLHLFMKKIPNQFN